VDLGGIAFDAFGTLFDLSALRTRTRQAAGHEGDELFAAFKDRMIPWTWHMTASGDYRPFPELAAVAVQAAAYEAGLRLELSRAEWVVEGLKELPAFDDVRPGLDQLKQAGIPLAVLSNGTAEGVDALIEHNGLQGVFAHALVADSVKRFKPAREVYALAVDAFGVPADRVGAGLGPRVGRRRRLAGGPAHGMARARREVHVGPRRARRHRGRGHARARGAAVGLK
jgi:2-haloacid dehalogenase